MRAWRIALLWALALALWMVHRAEERRAAGPAPAAETAAAPLLAAEAEDVAAIRLVDGSVTLELGPRTGTWEVTAPAGAGVPPDLVRAFLESLLGAAVLDAVDPAAEPEGGFALDEGRRIEVDLRDGSRRVFVVGGSTPTGTASYLRDETGAILVIGRNPLVYRDLLLDAVRPPSPEAPAGPVARVPIDVHARAGLGPGHARKRASDNPESRGAT